MKLQCETGCKRAESGGWLHWLVIKFHTDHHGKQHLSSVVPEYLYLFTTMLVVEALKNTAQSTM